MDTGTLLSFDRWLPEKFQAVNDHAEALRIRIFLILILLCIIPLLPLIVLLTAAIVFGSTGFWQPAIIVAVICTGQTSCLFYFLKSGNINLCSSIYAAIIFTLIGAASLFTGGFDSPVCTFMLALPVIASLVLGRLAGFLFSLAVLLLYVFFYYLSQHGFVAEQLIAAQYLPYASLAMWFTTLSFIVGCLLLFDFSTNDLSKAIQQEKIRWQKDLEFDELTGMLNQKAFLDLIEKYQSQMDTQTDTAIIYIRIENIKSLNQNFGVEVGDQFLKITGSNILSTTPEGAICSRYTADSFAIFLRFIDNLGDFISIITALTKNLKKNITVNNELVICQNLKIGAAVTSNFELSHHALIHAAQEHSLTNDRQLYIRIS